MKNSRHRLRQMIVPFSGVVLTLGLLAGCHRKEAPRGNTARLNVLFISVDDLRPSLGCYGVDGVYSPNIDALAREGVVLTRAYAQQAWCSPSRTSLLTGLRPDSTRVYDLETHFRSTVPDAVTLPQYFKKHNYFAAAFGKVFHESLDDSLSWSVPTWIPPVTDPLRHYVLPRNVALAAQRRGYAQPAERVATGDEAYPDGQITGEAIRMLRQVKDRPFFLAVGFYKPHLPFAAPEKYWKLYDKTAFGLPALNRPPESAPAWAFMQRAEHHNYVGVPPIPNGQPLPDTLTRHLTQGYYACVSYIDAQIGRLTAALSELGLAENTVVIVWGDHGWKLGEYGAWSKHTNYEVDTRVPLIIKVPGLLRRGIRPDALVELLDVYPTLAEVAGLPAPAGVQGVSFAPLLRGERTTHKKAAFSQFIRNAGRTHTTNRQAVIMGQAVRTENFRLIRWLDRREPGKVVATELYDHLTDPHETENRAGKGRYAAAIGELTAMLDHNFQLGRPD